MLKVRIIPSLLIKGSSVVKTTKYSNPRIVGDAISTVKVFSKRLADEMIIVDIDAHNLNKINYNLISNFTSFCNMPLTIGGGIKKLEDAKKIIELGAEKVLIGSSFYNNPKLIEQVVKNFGSSSVVFSLDVALDNEGNYQCFYNSGKEKSELSILEVVNNVTKAGAGEIVVNSISREGTYKGFDLNLFKFVNDITDIPIIISCGCGSKEDTLEIFKEGANAISAGSVFFWIGETILSIKEYLHQNNINVRLK